MLNLQLYPIRDETALGMLRQIDARGELRVSTNSCFWLGSVSQKNETALRQFLRAAEEENLIELTKHQSFDDSIAYAILVRDVTLENRFHLFIIESGSGLWTDSRFLLGKDISQECAVEAKEETQLPVGLVPNPRAGFLKSFITASIPRSVKALFFSLKRGK